MTALAANPYDQFDASPATGTSSPSANPYDQFDPATPPAPPSIGADIAKSTAANLAQGVYAIPGQLGDIERGAKWLMDTATEIPDYGMLWAQGKVAEMAGQLPPGQTASDWATQKLGQLNATREGVNAMPNTAEIAGGAHALGVPDYQSKTVPGQYAGTIASFVPQALLAPEKSVADIVGNVVKYALAPGIASETAGQLTSGTPAEPWARGIAAAGTGVGIVGAEAMANAAQKFAQPFTKAGQEARAASDLAGSFTNPQAAQAELAKAAALQAPGAGMGEIVPGSRPTTGQLTGDLGALSTERAIATANDTLFKNNEFGTGSEQQNRARSAALGSIQAEGDPAAVSATLRDQLSQIEAAHDQAVTDATTSAQTAGAKIGTGAAPEDVGESLRSTLQSARDAAKTQERQLWGAVDPDGTLALPAAPIAAGAAKIAGEVPSTAKPMSGEEAAIFDTASNLPAVAPFSDITALRSRISSAMRQELMTAGQSETYRRLSMLRGNVEDAIGNAVENRAARAARG